MRGKPRKSKQGQVSHSEEKLTPGKAKVTNPQTQLDATSRKNLTRQNVITFDGQSKAATQSEMKRIRAAAIAYRRPMAKPRPGIV